MNAIAAAQKEKAVDGKQPKEHSFIFQLQRPNPAAADEIFSTVVDETIARDIAKINQEIIKVIPAIKNRVFVLKWADSEGTETRVCNNEALGTALHEMKGPIYKWVSVKYVVQWKL